MPPETAYTAEPLGPGTTAVAVAGEVTFSNVVDFDRALGQALDEGAQNLVVDLTAVTFIDSSGLSSLLTASARARDARRDRRARARGGRAAVDLPLPRRRPAALALSEPRGRSGGP